MPRYLSPDALRLNAPESSTSALRLNANSFVQTLRKAHSELLSAHNGEVASLRAYNEHLESKLHSIGKQANSQKSAEHGSVLRSSSSDPRRSIVSVNDDTDTVVFYSEDLFGGPRKKSVEFEGDSEDELWPTNHTKQAKGDAQPAEQEPLTATQLDNQAESSHPASQAAEPNIPSLMLQQAQVQRSYVPDDLPDPFMLQNGMTSSDAVRLSDLNQLSRGRVSPAPLHLSSAPERMSIYSGQAGRRNSVENAVRDIRISGTSRGSTRSSDWTFGQSLDTKNRSVRNSLSSITELQSNASGSQSLRVETTHERSINRAASAERKTLQANGAQDTKDFSPERMSMFGNKDADSQSGTSVDSSFEVLKVWSESQEPNRGNSGKSSAGGGSMRTKSARKRWTKKLAATISNEDIIALAQRAVYEEVGTTSCFRYFISYPSSRLRLLWDVIGMVFVLHDVMMIPLSAFNVQDYEGSKTLNLLMLVFWTLDIPASLTVGYLSKTKVVMHPMLIAKRYVKTWFLIDISVLCVEWSILIAKNLASSGDGNDADSLSLLRTFRIFRTVRLIRFLKLQKVFRRIQDMIHTEYIAVLCDIMKLLLLLVMLSHLMACGWYAVGNNSREHQRENWIDQLHMNDTLYRYTSSLHWSLTQFTPASMDVQPRNVPERIYAIAVLLAGLLVFSGMVSSITSSLVQLRKMSEDDTKQLWMLRRYLSERTVPPLLSARIHQYLEHMLDRGAKHVQEESVTILRLLSSGLRTELQYTIKTRHVVAHALFDHISKVTNATMFRLTDAMFRTLMACADTLFFQGEESHAMYFVVCGEMRYVQDECLLAGGESKSKRTKLLLNQKDVRADSWMCEPGLWTSWVHLGDLHALVECDLITIDSDKFREVMVQNPPVRGMVSQYARAFVRQLNMLQDNLLNDLCDCLDYDHLRKNMEAWMHGEDPPELAPSPGIHREERTRVNHAKSMTKSLSMGMKQFSMKTLSLSNVSLLKTFSLTSLTSMLTRSRGTDAAQDDESESDDEDSPRSPGSPGSPKQRDSGLRRSGTEQSTASSLAANIAAYAQSASSGSVDFESPLNLKEVGGKSTELIESSTVKEVGANSMDCEASLNLKEAGIKSVGFEEHVV